MSTTCDCATASTKWWRKASSKNSWTSIKNSTRRGSKNRELLADFPRNNAVRWRTKVPKKELWHQGESRTHVASECVCSITDMSVIMAYGAPESNRNKRDRAMMSWFSVKVVVIDHTLQIYWIARFQMAAFFDLAGWLEKNDLRNFLSKPNVHNDN